MRLFVLALILAALAFAYVVPTEGLDVFYWAKLTGVSVVGVDGAVLWSVDAVYPLAASDAAGRCFAVVNRPYVYTTELQRVDIQVSAPVDVELSPDFVATLAQYGISMPSRIRVTMNFTLPLPPLVLAGVHKTAVASLHMPYGYPLWAVTLGRGVNATAVATDCRDVVVGTISGSLYLLRDGKIVDVRDLGEPVTAAAPARGGGAFFVGTAGGKIYSYSGGVPSLVGTCGGAVYSLAPAPDGSVSAACFSKSDRPVVEYYPYSVRLTPGVVVAYGIDTPKTPAALSQDGRVFVVGLLDEVVAYSGGSVLWRAKLPSMPLSVAVSGNGSIVAVGTLGGDVIVFWKGREAARFSGSKPATSVAVSVDGRTIAVERWDSAGAVRLAFAQVQVDAPPQCLPAEVAVRVGDAVYSYTVGASGTILLPVGRVSVEPRYKYLGDSRCRPLYNLTLTVGGDLTEPLKLQYVLEYKITLKPANITRGAAWAAGTATFFAEPVVEIPVVDSPVQSGRLVLAGWRVNGRDIALSTPTLSVNVAGPTEVAALYRVVLPETVPIDQDNRLRLDLVLVFDRFGNPLASDKSPVVSEYPLIVRGSYARQVRMVTDPPASVNGSTVFWADAGSTVVFYAPDVELRNNTKLGFKMWRETEERNNTVVLTAERPTRLTPVYVKQYRVWVRPPGRVVNPPNATWADRGSVVTISIPEVLETRGDVRTVFDKWVINGVINATLRATATIRVTAPLNITYTTKQQYLASFTTTRGSVMPSMWVDAGSIVGVVPMPTDMWSPPPLHWVFAGWRDVNTGVFYAYPSMPVAASPTTFEAVWNLDPVPLVAIGASAGGAAFAVWLIRRRRLREMLAEITE